MRNDAQRTVLTTLALADAFGWALTAFEAWRYALETGRMDHGSWIMPARRSLAVPFRSLVRRRGGVGDQETEGAQGLGRENTPTLHQTLTVLDELVAEGALVEQDGHYVFPGREALITERLWRSQLVGQKRRKARRWARWLVRLPYVEGVFAYGSLATGHASKESDLDVFVVLRDGRIFTGRLLVSFFLEMFGARRTATKVENQVCLNHFVVERALEFPKEYRSPFSAWLWARMFPLAVTDPSLPDRFYEANKWVTDYFPNLGVMEHGTWNMDQGEPGEPGRVLHAPGYVVNALERRTVPTRGLAEQGPTAWGPTPRSKGARLASSEDEAAKRPWGRTPMIQRSGWGDALERLLGRMQLQRIQRHPLTRKGEGRVVANERMMIFHPGLPEDEVMGRFEERVTEVLAN